MSRRPAITDKMKMEVLRPQMAMIPCAICQDRIFKDEGRLGFIAAPRAYFGFEFIQFDHIQALVDGGKHEVENVRAVCLNCHRTKSAFEHKRNSKSKRLAAARTEHEAVLSRVMKREPSRIRSRGFGPNTKKFSGAVSPSKRRKPDHASTD